MWPKTLAILGSVGLIGTALFAMLGGKAPATQPKPPIALEEIDTRGIQGRLGFRLGTVLSASGHIIPNTSQRKADVDEPFFVRVENVNRKRLDSPVDFPARDFRLSEQIKSLKIGDSFSCTGFETGGYNDFVDDTSQGISAHPGYGFVDRFHVFTAK